MALAWLAQLVLLPFDLALLDSSLGAAAPMPECAPRHQTRRSPWSPWSPGPAAPKLGAAGQLAGHRRARARVRPFCIRPGTLQGPSLLFRA